MMTIPIRPVAHPVDQHPDLLRDESQLAGTAEHLFLPRNSGEITAILRALARRGETVIVQGARTGIAGGAVPRGGAILNLAGLDRVLGLRFDYRQTNGVHYVSVPGMIAWPQGVSTYGIVDVHPDRLVLRGKGKCPSRILPVANKKKKKP